jgi:hypothetical protein
VRVLFQRVKRRDRDFCSLRFVAAVFFFRFCVDRILEDDSDVFFDTRRAVRGFEVRAATEDTFLVAASVGPLL